MKKTVALLLCALLILLQAFPAFAQEPEEDTDSPLIWMDTLTIEYPDGKEYATAGDTVYIFVAATDNVEIKSFWFELESPDGSNNIEGYMAPVGINDYYYYAFVVDENTDAGYWTLSRMTLTDTSDHSMYLYDPESYHIGVHGSFTEDEVTLTDGGSYVYSPSGVKPDVSITHRGITLKKDTDYTVTYDNNKNVGTATVTVKGINCYDGKVCKSFEISPQTKFSAGLSCNTYYYTKEVKTPKVILYDGDKKIAASNYTVTYPKGRKAVGTYAVKVKMQGNYSGSKTLYFTINPKNTKIKSVTSKRKSFVIKWKQRTSQVTGYQIRYSTSSKFTDNTTKTITIKTNKTVSKTVKSLKANKKYYVQLRTINTKGGKLYHSKWSKTQTVKTN